MAASYEDVIVHVLLVTFSLLVLFISLVAYVDRRNSRYMLLSLAFAFLFSSQVAELAEEMFLSSRLILLPATSIHLTHFLDFLTLASFSGALTLRPGDGDGKRPGE